MRILEKYLVIIFSVFMSLVLISCGSSPTPNPARETQTETYPLGENRGMRAKIVRENQNLITILEQLGDDINLSEIDAVIAFLSGITDQFQTVLVLESARTTLELLQTRTELNLRELAISDTNSMEALKDKGRKLAQFDRLADRELGDLEVKITKAMGLMKDVPHSDFSTYRLNRVNLSFHQLRKRLKDCQ